MIIHDEKNEAPIDEVWAFLSLEPDGTEGICAAPLPGLGMQPLVTSKLRVAEAMKPLAAIVAKIKPVRLVRFARAEVVEEFK